MPSLAPLLFLRQLLRQPASRQGALEVAWKEYACQPCSVIVNNRNACRAMLCPLEAESVVLIDADAVLSLPVALNGLQMIAGRKPQV